MTPDQMRAQSSKKVSQIMELMQVLHLRVEARQRINEQGFIENTLFWIDEEKYPEPAQVPQAEPAQQAEETQPEAKTEDEVTEPQDVEKTA